MIQIYPIWCQYWYIWGQVSHHWLVDSRHWFSPPDSTDVGRVGDVRYGSKVGQIGTNQGHIRWAKMYWNMICKYLFVPYEANLAPFGAKTASPRHWRDSFKWGVQLWAPLNAGRLGTKLDTKWDNYQLIRFPEDMDSVNQNVPINNRPLNKSQKFRM